MKWTQAMDRIFSELAEAFQRAGRGSIQRAEKGLKVYQGFFRKARHRNRLDLPKLLQAFEILDIHPGEFFENAFRQQEVVDDPVRDFGREAESLVPRYRDVDSVLEWRRFDTLGFLSEEQQRRARALEDRLVEAPEQVRSQARQHCFEAVMISNLSLLLRNATIWASALLYGEHEEPAQAILWRAMHLARTHDHQPALAELALRCAQLAIKQQKPAAARVFAQEAAGIFAMVGQPTGVARSLIVISNVQLSLGQPDEATSSLRSALRFLDEEQTRESFFIYFQLSLKAFREHDLEQSAGHAARARESLAGEPARSPLRGYMAWLEARLASRDPRQGKDRVEDLYRQASVQLAQRPGLRSRLGLELESFLHSEESARYLPRPPERVLPYAFDLEGGRLADLVLSELAQHALDSAGLKSD